MYEFSQNSTRNFIGGACPYQCKYCYVQDLKRRNEVIRKKYSGKPFLCHNELKKGFGRRDSSKIWFIGTMTDMFAESVPPTLIETVLSRLRQFPETTFLFQSKNPERFTEFEFPRKSILCTTIESNLDYPGMSLAPKVKERAGWIAAAGMEKELPIMITVEPILDFNVKKFTELLLVAGLYQVNIGADSKGNKLPEPSWEKVTELIAELQRFDIKVYLKPNLKRLIDKHLI